MGLFTNIGATLWNWQPFIELDDGPRNLWLALYTSAHAKAMVPGLWHGSIHSMAEAAHRDFQSTITNLDALLDAEGSFDQPLVEYDDKHRVLRMTELPDAGEYPTAPSILSSWWSKFLLVPPCQMRDAHVTLVRWILDEGAKRTTRSAKKNWTGRPTPAHEEVWSETFATIPVPAQRRRGVRRVLDADTGNEVQPSLFAPPSHSSSRALSTGSPQPLQLDSAISTTKDPKSNDLTVPESHSSGSGVGVGVGVGDLAEADRDLDLGSPRESSRHGDPDPAAIENAIRPRPALALVPPQLAMTPEQLVAEICTGMGAGSPRVRQTVRETLRASLCATLRVFCDKGWGVPEARLAGKWLASSHGRHLLPQIASGCPPDESVCQWASRPGNVVACVENAQDHEKTAADRSAFLASLTQG